jgi:hypothetical protein
VADVVVNMKASDPYQVNEAYVLSFCTAHLRATTDHWLLYSAKRLLIPVFALQLLLNMKNVGDPGTRKIVSTLLFAGPNTESGESEAPDPSGLIET